MEIGANQNSLRSSSMRKMLGLCKKGFIPFLCLAIGVLIIGGCATTVMNQEASEKAKAPVIESIRVMPSPDQTVVEVLSTITAPYTAYKLSIHTGIMSRRRTWQIGCTFIGGTQGNGGSWQSIKAFNMPPRP